MYQNRFNSHWTTLVDNVNPFFSRNKRSIKKFSRTDNHKLLPSPVTLAEKGNTPLPPKLVT